MTEDVHAAQTVAQLVRAAAAVYGATPAILRTGDGTPDEIISFVDLDQRSALLARGLVARGVGKGARIGFVAGNGPHFAIMLAAIARIGAIAIPISTMIRANELIRVLRQSDVAGLLVERKVLGHDMVERLCEALPALQAAGRELRLDEVPFLRWIVSHGDGLPPSIGDYGAILNGAASVQETLLRAIEAEVHPSDQALEIYTSGSMALPKGVKHNHGPLIFRARYVGGMLGLESGRQVAAVMPMFWIGGLMMSLMSNWAAGATTICGDRTLNNSRVAIGTVLSEDDLKAMEAARPPFWGIGMSETMGPYSYGDVVRAPGHPMCAPLDHWANGFEVRIADENDVPVAEDEVGELQVRGYPVTPGLHKIENRDCFTADGFYRTGDMARFGRARTHFVGRSGDMIKTVGSNVSPAEVEMEMQALDEIETAFVVGLPDRERGQIVVAAVIARDAQPLDFTAIETILRKKLSSYKVPRAYVQIDRAEVPMLHSNKVARREVARMMAERLERSA